MPRPPPMRSAADPEPTPPRLPGEWWPSWPPVCADFDFSCPEQRHKTGHRMIFLIRKDLLENQAARHVSAHTRVWKRSRDLCPRIAGRLTASWNILFARLG